MSDLKQRITSAALKLEELDVPEWGGKVYVRRMSAAQRDVFLAATQLARESNNYAGIDRLLVALTLCDEKGILIFDNQSELDGLDAVALDRASKAAMRVNALSSEAQADLAKK